MALFTKGDLSPEEMKEIAKQNGIKLSKEDIVMIAQMKKRDLKQKKEENKKKSKD